MVMLTEQFLIDYLLIAAGLLTVASGMLGSLFLGTVCSQPGRWVRLLPWGVPATLLTTALWSLLLPLTTALLVGAATAATMVAGLLLMPCGIGRRRGGSWRGLVAEGLFCTGRTGLMLAPAVVAGHAPAWVFWLSLAGLVPAVCCAVHRLGDARASDGVPAGEGGLWGGAQGAVLGGVPALLLVL